MDFDIDASVNVESVSVRRTSSHVVFLYSLAVLHFAASCFHYDMGVHVCRSQLSTVNRKQSVVVILCLSLSLSLALRVRIRKVERCQGVIYVALLLALHVEGLV